MIRLLMLAGFIALWPSFGLLLARPPTDARPSFSEWFRSLLDPETSLPCCNEADYRTVASRVVIDHYEVLIDTAWVAVPAERIVRRADNPTGHAVLCWTPVLGIMCFVPGPGV
jgi:hypothetical protein